MMPYLLALALTLAALLQVSFLPVLRIQGVYPDLCLVLVVGWSLLRGTKSAAVWAVIIGLWLDLLSRGVLGTYTLALLAAAYLAGLGRRIIYHPSFVLALGMTTLTTVVQAGFQITLLGRDGSFAWNNAVLRLLLIQIAYNSALLLLIYPLLSWVHRVTGRERLPLE